MKSAGVIPALLALAALLGACARSPSPAPAPAATAQPASPAPAAAPAPSPAAAPTEPPTMTQHATIDAETLEEAAEEGVIALVRAGKAEVTHAGTRSESVRIETEVVTSLRGDAPRPLILRRYTSRGDPVLAAGRLYIVSAIPDARFAPALQLTGHVPVADGQQDAALAAHRAMLDRK